MDSTSDAKADLRKNIANDYREFRSATKMWSFVWHGSQLGSAVLTALGALVLKSKIFTSDVTTQNDWGAALAAAATLLITLLTMGQFKDKWEANRIAAFAVRDLSYELEKSHANMDDILSSLQRIGLVRNNAIVGLPPAQSLSKDKPDTGAQTVRVADPVNARLTPEVPDKLDPDTKKVQRIDPAPEPRIAEVNGKIDPDAQNVQPVDPANSLSATEVHPVQLGATKQE